MVYLGFSGGFDLAHENVFDLRRGALHDGAAALVVDGEVVAAVEEERLNRIKHSNKFPELALRHCLARQGLRPSDVERFAFYSTEVCADAVLADLHLRLPGVPHRESARGLLSRRLSETFDEEIAPDRIAFHRHHLAHAVSATALSGFDRSLVLAIDGFGDFLSGLVGVAEGATVTELATFSESASLGLFYIEVIELLGYRQFDEYKVMGLAPYGDAAAFRPLLQQLYKLLPDGQYELHRDRIMPVLLGAVDVRKPGQPVTRQHQDLAAALQEALETIVLHVLTHYRRETGLSRLSLAGGVALNCTMNGRIARSGLFEDIFVQPAAHDAGCAVGAALLASHEAGTPTPPGRLRHVYWGTDLGGGPEIEAELKAWQGFLTFERTEDVTATAAGLLAEGAVLGWVRGRAEFGPRALGNRSILADPRPAANRERINRMVKKRESFRPFAPSVRAEDAAEFFELPAATGPLPFMLCALPVREDKRALLGATTHVDGSARVQTVSRDANPRYWELLTAFRELTGVGVLLNTSFNNNVEPIVDSARDAVVAFLTTELDYLVAGDFLVRKRTPTAADRRALRLSLPSCTRLSRTKTFVTPRETRVTAELGTTYDGGPSAELSAAMYELLAGLEGEQTVGDLLDGSGGEAGGLLRELEELWALRLVLLRP